MSITRRRFLSSTALAAAAGATASLLGRRGITPALAAPAEPTQLVSFFFIGGFHALFNTSELFRTTAVGTDGANITMFPTTAPAASNLAPLYVDNATNLMYTHPNAGAPTSFSSLPETWASMTADAINAGYGVASVGYSHHQTAHQPARAVSWVDGPKSFPVVLSSAIESQVASTGAVKAATLGGYPAGAGYQENGISLQNIGDLSLAAQLLLGVPATAGNTNPSQALVAEQLAAIQIQSQRDLWKNPKSLLSMQAGMESARFALLQPPLDPTFSLTDLQTAYGAPSTTTLVQATDFRSKMMGAEMLVRAGANTISIFEGGAFDSHGMDGDENRAMFYAPGQYGNGGMPSRIASMRILLNRIFALPNRNITVMMFGDFGRSLNLAPDNNGHGSFGVATVMSKRIHTGTIYLPEFYTRGTAMIPDIRSTTGTPGIRELWELVGDALGITSNPLRSPGGSPYAALLK